MLFKFSPKSLLLSLLHVCLEQSTVLASPPLAVVLLKGLGAPTNNTGCTSSWGDCTVTNCCEKANMHCYAKNDRFAQCRPDCQPGLHLEDNNSVWNCTIMDGGNYSVEKELLAEAAQAPFEKACASAWGDCSLSKCCDKPNMHCYAKNDHFAQCRPDCMPGMHPEDQNRVWNCNVLAPDNKSVAAHWDACERHTEIGELIPEKPWPSLYCWAVLAPFTSEPRLMAHQFRQKSGIFSCDGFAVVSNLPSELVFRDRDVSRHIEISIINQDMHAEMDPNQDGHLLNSPIFMKAWKRILADGDFALYDWTLKLDVDAFLIPGRLRQALLRYGKEPMFLTNVGYDSIGNLLHGPVEALNKEGARKYKADMWKCEVKPEHWAMGEDIELNLCFKEIGLNASNNLWLMDDAYTFALKYVMCGTAHAVFHPLKDTTAWDRCMAEVCSAPHSFWGVERVEQVDKDLLPWYMKFEISDAKPLVAEKFSHTTGFMRNPKARSARALFIGGPLVVSMMLVMAAFTGIWYCRKGTRPYLHVNSEWPNES